jgi:hypothetical protein
VEKPPDRLLVLGLRLVASGMCVPQRMRIEVCRRRNLRTDVES